ncbi:MAG: HAMP domain-containing protein [Dethiobacteraceae bacterium]|jgi:signal transduction histidine kinase|nr:HAMP domain-containing protein [Bacillota bacterium]
MIEEKNLRKAAGSSFSALKNRLKELQLTYSPGLRSKFVLLWLFLVLSTGLWFTWQCERITHTVMLRDLQHRGLCIARNVASRGADPFLSSNHQELQQIINDTVANNEDLLYLFIQDPQGRVIVSSQPEQQLPADLLLRPLTPGDNYQTINHANTEIIHDFAVPISSDNAATIRLGIAETNLRHALSRIRRALISTLLAALIVGGLITAFFTNKLLGPLRRLTAAAHTIREGDFSARVPIQSFDEMGELAAAFNLMAEKLSTYKLENIENRAELDRIEKLRVQLVQHLITAQEEERKRIARELHDETSQSLTALKLGLKAMEQTTSPAGIQELSRELRQMLGATLDEITAISRNLRPSVLDDMGLQAALARLIEESSHRIGKKIIYKHEGLVDKRFPAYIETAVYRIVQEAVTNSLKYAQAENIFVSVSYQQNQLKAIVADDGIGFDPAAVLDGNIPQKGFGLFGMQERATLIDGTLQIDAATGQGTTITVTVPNVQEAGA